MIKFQKTSLAVWAVLMSSVPSLAENQTAPSAVDATANIDWSQAQTLTVRMTDFEFSPDHLALRLNTPVRLILVNEGSGTHIFSAPKLFAVSAFRAGSTPPADNKIAVGKAQTKEIDLVPKSPGVYPLRCTEFLHAMFGMTGVIEVGS